MKSLLGNEGAFFIHKKEDTHSNWKSPDLNHILFWNNLCKFEYELGYIQAWMHIFIFPLILIVFFIKDKYSPSELIAQKKAKFLELSNL